jgi:hypothetical protein
MAPARVDRLEGNRPAHRDHWGVDKARPTSVVFARLNDEGDVIRVLDRRAVRRGTVKLRFARGGRYMVRVGDIRRTYEVCGAGGGTAELRYSPAATS